MSDRTLTHPTDGLWTSASSRHNPELWGLALAWSLAEPARVGETALVEPGRPCVFGREPTAGDTRWLQFGRHRPTARHATPPLVGRSVSRRQLELVASQDGLHVANVGRCPMTVNGLPATDAVLTAGDTVQLKNQLVFVCVRRHLHMRPLRSFPDRRARGFGEADDFGLVGESPAIWQVRDELALAAGTELPVLIVGESGAGKELVARAIHRLSSRGSHLLVSRNAATFPETLIDAEMFGNAVDFPNVGTPAREGLVGLASGGTLFLDEIGELPQKLQSHLLRLLDGGEYQRLGDPHPRRADVRVIAATNRAIEELKGDFAARLITRVRVPGLNTRREDIPLLLRHLGTRLREQASGAFDRFVDGTAGELRLTPALVEQLVRHAFTHHVRELTTALWRAMATSDADFVEPLAAPAAVAVAPDTGELTPEAIQACLDRHDGNQSAAYKELGLSSRYALRRLIKKHGLSPRGKN